jgi:18S rRNA (guanine1575-N7)-methyltransferase
MGGIDGLCSISCIQWLCNADVTSHHPRRRLARFFSTLYASLSNGARAIFQFYPENDHQIDLITSSAHQAGFSGGLVVDYPNSSKRKKYFLCLFAGQSSSVSGSGKQVEMPKGKVDDFEGSEGTARVRVQGHGQQQRYRGRDGKKRKGVKDKEWVMRKKDVARRRGEVVAADSKYTARKRRPRF